MVQLGFGVRGDGGDQFIAELAPDRRADLRDLLDRRETIEPRHQRIAQGERYRERARSRGIFVAVARIPEIGGFQDRLGQLLDKQRHAVGLEQDLFQQIRGQRLAVGEPGYHRSALRPRELRRDVSVATCP